VSDIDETGSVMEFSLWQFYEREKRPVVYFRAHTGRIITANPLVSK